MEHIKKQYYGGYKPKSNNVVKLEAYVKNANLTGTSRDFLNDKSKVTTSRANKVLKNKRIL